MSFAVGLYGYTFTRRFTASGLDFVPVYEDIGVVRAKAKDKTTYHLTGLILIPVSTSFELRSWQQIFFDVEDALTFIEQQRVVLSNSVEILPGENPLELLHSKNDFSEALPHTLAHGHDLNVKEMRPTSGSFLQSDAFHSSMRLEVLTLLLAKLSDEAFLSTTGFRAAFFRNVEMIRLGNVAIDVSYSLLFTGIELLAHKKMGPVSGGLPELLYRFLEEIGLPITRDEGKQIAACRNALFHRGEYEAEYQPSGGNNMAPVKLKDLPRLNALFADTLLKILHSTILMLIGIAGETGWHSDRTHPLHS